jgi:alanyl-tRNA synthetase
VQVDGLRVLSRRIDDLDRAQMRHLADNLKTRADVVVLGTAREGRVSLLVAVRDEAAERVPARDLADRLARICGGRGGGRATLAEAGGRNPALLDEVLRRGSEEVRHLLEEREAS